MDNKVLIKKYGKDIVFAIIAYIIFTFFLQPLMDFLGNSIFMISERSFKRFNDELYMGIALYQSSLEIMSFIYIFGLYVILFLVTLLWIVKLENNQIIKIDKLSQRINDNENNYKENSVKKTKDELKSAMLTTKIKFLKATKMIKISVCTGIIVFIISNIISIAIEIKINEKINKFEIDKKIIAPYINDKELIILESQFHQMKNQKDYNDVYMKINNIKKINGVITAK